MEPIKGFEKKYNVKIVCSQETEPLGTAGPIKLAKDIITKDNTAELFYVLNSDIICEFPLKEMLEFHKKHGKEGTILLTKVDDPSKYGVIVADGNGKIKRFVEKPKEFISDRINAGIYLLSTKVIDRIELKPTMIEKDVFPKMAEEGVLYCLDYKGFWEDVGQPKDYLIGTEMILTYYKKNKPEMLAQGANIVGNVLLDKSAKISPSAVIGPNVCIGENCVVEDGVRLQNVVMLKGSKIKQFTWITNSIIGWNSSVGKWVRIEGMTVMGEDVHIKDELFINGAAILPHKSISESIFEKGLIKM